MSNPWNDDNENRVVFENAEIRTSEDAREEAASIRDEAPDREYLTDGRTRDIDDVIDALERAKAEGIDTVKVNDDGAVRGARPVITNNQIGHHSLAPPPKALFEWVEL